MPRGDGTGPMGMGPMTGRGAGYCAGFAMPGMMNPLAGRGCVWGMGGGRGWRNMFYATGQTGWQRAMGGSGMPADARLAPDQELAALKNQAEIVENALGGIRKRIESLEGMKKNP